MQDDAAKKAFDVPFGDHLSLLSIWNNWVESGFDSNWCYDIFIQVRSMKRERDVRDQLVSLVNRVEIPLMSNSRVLATLHYFITIVMNTFIFYVLFTISALFI